MVPDAFLALCSGRRSRSRQLRGLRRRRRGAAPRAGGEKECSGVPTGVGVNVTVEALAPTRLTRAQQHVLTTASYRYFAPTITAGSGARDPWADARLAIDGFAGKLAAVCRDLPQQGHPAG